MIDLKIDGQPIQIRSGATVMEAALENGIDIPHICYHPELSVSGGCRLCMVEIEGRHMATASCGLLCEEGMVVQTQSEGLTKIRRDVIDMFVAEHPLDCVVCEKSGACLLQKYAYEYGVSEASVKLQVPRDLYQDDNPFFIRDHQYCILCGKCVRACSEIVGADAIEIVGRGFESHVATPFDSDMIDSTCVFCGNCVQVCPTAALMPVSRKGKGREWEMEWVKTVCGYCGVGCQIEYALKDGQIIYARSPEGATVNGDFLCTKGRHGWDFSTHPERLTSPLIRRDVAKELGLVDEEWELPATSPLAVRKINLETNYVQVGWDTALNLVAERLASIVKENGPDSVMGLASARCTNEENYIFQKFIRAGVGTNNLDHCARL